MIGYAHGGVGEILDTLYPAGKVARGDTDGLLERAVQCLAAPQAVPENSTYTLDTMLARTLDLYRQLAGESALTGTGSHPP